MRPGSLLLLGRLGASWGCRWRSAGAQCRRSVHMLAMRWPPFHAFIPFILLPILLPRDALDFLAKLSRKYSGRVTQLLERRREQQARFDAGEKPVFLPETKKVRMLLV